MSNITRHLGVVRSTGSRVIVLWRYIPDDVEHCLVVYTDSIPEMYTHAVQEITLGKGQASIDLWEVMDKVGYLDGKKMLDVLHSLSYIRKQRTADIDMHIGNGGKIALSELNREINSTMDQKDGKVKDYNPFSNQETDFVEHDTIVNKLIREAQEYDRLSKETFERVYTLEPSLRPQAQVLNEVPESDTRSFYLEIPEGISQAKAIEKLKKLLQERKA